MQEEIQQILETKRWALSALWGISTFLYINCNLKGICSDGLYHFVSWIGVLALLGLSRRYLNFSNRLSAYFIKASFPIYIFHMTWIIVIGYYVFPIIPSSFIQVIIILAFSFLLTIITYEIVKKISILRYLFAVKK